MEQSQVISGRCLCGNIVYEIATIESLVLCHCRQCRKAQGAAFASNFSIDEVDYRLVKGSDLVRCYQSSATKQRYFSGCCGSPLYSRRDGASQLRIRSGTLDDNLGLIAEAHIFATNLPTWAKITDALPQYSGMEPGRKNR